MSVSKNVCKTGCFAMCVDGNNVLIRFIRDDIQKRHNIDSIHVLSHISEGSSDGMNMNIMLGIPKREFKTFVMALNRMNIPHDIIDIIHHYVSIHVIQVGLLMHYKDYTPSNRVYRYIPRSIRLTCSPTGICAILNSSESIYIFLNNDNTDKEKKWYWL